MGKDETVTHRSAAARVIHITPSEPFVETLVAYGVKHISTLFRRPGVIRSAAMRSQSRCDVLTSIRATFDGQSNHG